MIVYANAKLNLALYVTGKDPSDGYHTIDSLFQEIGWADQLEIQPAERDRVEFVNGSLGKDTTVHRALDFFKRETGLKQGFDVRVWKNIPMGAGLGGGSSDAAAVLGVLNGYYPIQEKLLFDIATSIGSDVPFFLKGGLSRVEGKGERITPLSARLKGVWFLVVYPNIHVSTARAYDWITKFDVAPDFLIKKGTLTIDFLRKIMYNTFQNFVEEHFPDLKGFYRKLRDIFHSDVMLMSGSGSSVFFVYSDYQRAVRDLKLLESTEGVSCHLCEPVYPGAVR